MLGDRSSRTRVDDCRSCICGGAATAPADGDDCGDDGDDDCSASSDGVCCAMSPPNAMGSVCESSGWTKRARTSLLFSRQHPCISSRERTRLVKASLACRTSSPSAVGTCRRTQTRPSEARWTSARGGGGGE
eukprot:7137930-Prymnesium_polylepis.1